MALSEYEWEDETGMRHPSLVKLDVTGINPDNLTLSVEEILNRATVLDVRPIDSFRDCFRPSGALDHRAVRTPKGYWQCWHYKAMDMERYALFVAYRRDSRGEECEERVRRGGG